MKSKSDHKDDNRLPGFDIWPPPPKPKQDKKKDNLPQNSSYRQEERNLDGDQAVYDVDEETREIEDKDKEREKSPDEKR